MRILTRPRRSRLGPLEALEYAASPGSTAVVCLHGYGADASDLAPIAAELDLPGPARWVFPNAPIVMGIGSFGQGRAWFPIDEARAQKAQIEGQPIDLSAERPDGFDEALASLRAFLEALEEPWERLILGGFSQGAMLALEAALGAPSAPAGLFLLSGTLADEPSLRRLAPARSGLRFFQSHGAQDPLLSHDAARRLYSLLAECGLKGRFLSFQGGHMLPREAVDGLEAYLAEVFPAQAADHQ